MVVTQRKVIWSDEAKLELKAAYNFISTSSPQNAAKVRSDIVGITRRLPLNPELHPPDKYKKGNDGSYRTFEKHKYRIVYRVTEHTIRILWVRHTKMDPLE